jgi:hypothetical protein
MAWQYQWTGKPRAMLDLGTPARAVETLGALQIAVQGSTADVARLARELDELCAVRAWELVPEGEPFGDPDTMLVQAIGMTMEELTAKHGKPFEDLAHKYGLAKVKPAASHGREDAPRDSAGRMLPESRPDHGKVRAEQTYGNSSRHIIARLKRDSASDPRAAAMLEAVGEGKATPNAAAVELGWRKKKPTVTLDEAPDRAAARLMERFGEAWCRDLVVALDAAVQRQGGGS